MRVLGTDEVPLDIALDDPPIIVVAVPSIGHLVVGLHPDEGWKAELHPIRSEAERVRRAMSAPVNERLWPPMATPGVQVVDGRVEVELLHKADRLCVVVEGMPDAATAAP